MFYNKESYSIENVLKKITVLDNGLRVVSDYIPHVETVSLGAWLNIGSRYETLEDNGISHVLEHMAFKGTHKRTALDISKAIENVGGYLNAYTSRESTAYYARVLKNDSAIAIDIISDILQNSLFQQGDLEKEKQVILQEIGQTLDTPDDIVFDYFQETCFPAQAIGRSILGPQENVQGFTRDDIDRYMKKYYACNNMVFAAAGNICHDDLVKNIQTCFKDFKKNGDDVCEKAIYKGGDFRQNKKLEQVHLLLGFEGVPLGHKNYFDQMILAMILGGGMSSRLFQEIRENRALVYVISAYVSPYKDTGVFGIYAGTGEEQIKELVPAVLLELKKTLTELSQEELDRSKTQLRASLLMGLESTSSRCERIANQILQYGRLIEVEEIEHNIEQTTTQSIQDFLHVMLKTKPTVTALGPVKNLLSYDDFLNLYNSLT